MLVAPGCCDGSVARFCHRRLLFYEKINLASGPKTLGHDGTAQIATAALFASYTIPYARIRTALLCCCIGTDVFKRLQGTQHKLPLAAPLVAATPQNR